MSKYIFYAMAFLMAFCFMACDDSSTPNQLPVLTIAADKVLGVAPFAVSFTASAEDPDGVISSYNWNFGNGIDTSPSKDISYLYSVPGTYTVTCTVKDNGKPALSTSASLVITVLEKTKVPVLNSISPSWGVIHMPEFTLTVKGTDFFPWSKIVFAGKEMATTYVSPTELSSKIEEADTVLFPSTDGRGGINLEADQDIESVGVLVRNPGNGGGDSSPISFTIKQYHAFSDSQMISIKSEASNIKIFFGKNLFVRYTFKGGSLICSADKGVSWGDEHEVPENTEKGTNDMTAYSAGALHKIYNSGSSVYLIKSTDNGVSWSAPVMIFAGSSDSGGCAWEAEKMNIVNLSGDGLLAAWEESLSGAGGCDDSHIRLSSSNDGGNTWSEPAIFPAGGTGLDPLLEKSGSGKIHLFYYLSGSSGQPEGPYYSWSADSGKTWSLGIKIYQGSNYSEVLPYVGYADELFLPVIQYAGPKRLIGFKVSYNSGAAWSDFNEITSLDSAKTITDVSFLEDSGRNLNVFYTYGSSDSDMAVYHQRSIDEGFMFEWNKARRVSPKGFKSYQTAVTCDEAGNLYVVFYSVFKNYPVYFTSSERNK